jgi:LPXTG-site transpeptidase (sortase) family protein
VHNNIGNYPILCSGGVDANYAFTYVAGSLSVTPRALTVTPADKSKIYGDVFAAFTGTILGIQSGDNITATYASLGAPAPAAIGNYLITASLNDPGNRLGNYTLTSNTATLTVTPRALVVTPNDASKIYGNVFNAFTGSIVGIQNSDAITATYTSAGSAATAIVNTYLITAALNAPLGILANYNVTSNTGTLTVTLRDLVVQPADKTKTFGTVFTAFTGSLVGVQNGDNITATYDSAGTPAAAVVGAYPITTTLNDPGGKLPNYNALIGPATLTVSLANQTITVTTHAPANAANNASFTVAATASSGEAVTYSASGVCTNLGDTFTITSPTGTCVVHYNQAGTADYNAAPEVTENVTALPNSQTITVTVPAPATSSLGTSFDVAATASSSLIVSITANGSCSVNDHADGTATITITAASGTCTVHYNQAGNTTYASAPQVTEVTTIDSVAPTVTSNQEAAQVDPTNVSPINFTVVFSEPVIGFTDTDVTIAGTAGATTAVATEIAPNDGTTYNIAISGMKSDGTVIVSIPAGAAKDIAGNDSFASSSTDNIVTYFDADGPTVGLVNTNPDTGGGALSESEKVTVNITHFMVKFSQDVYNPAGDSDVNDVTNPYNYMLVRDLGDTAGFQTVSCSAGAVIPADTNIAIGTVIYDSATSTATFTVNGNLPLSNGTYRLYICGTTSIVDPLDTTLKLVGTNGPSSDYLRNFTVDIAGSGGGDGGGGDGGRGSKKDAPNQPSKSLLIPVTGFAPDQVTLLPIQPAKEAYKTLDEIRVEIPTLGINFPIVGVSLSGNNWNLTWLKDSVGYLEGSAYPTFNGNSVLTAHVIDANNNLGPFSDIKGMHSNDKIYIHAYGKIYIYQVQENRKISSANLSAVFKHEEYSWVTLVTCEDYDAKSGVYKYRRMVRAILISVVPIQ